MFISASLVPNRFLSFRVSDRIKPCDFDYLRIIGKGSFGKVSGVYSGWGRDFSHGPCNTSWVNVKRLFSRFCWPDTKKRNSTTLWRCSRRRSFWRRKRWETVENLNGRLSFSFSCGKTSQYGFITLGLFVFFTQQKHIMAERSVLLKNIKHPFLVGLHYSFQTTDKLYFVLDYVNGGEVMIVFSGI